jgi:hypothetical protein
LNFLKVGFLFLAGSGCFSLVARAPEDYIQFPPAQKRGVRIIRNKNVTFTNDQPSASSDKQSNIVAAYNVSGRSRPNRNGRVLSNIRKGSVLNPIRISADKRWIAVVVVRSGIRAWVPRSVIPNLEDDLKIKSQSSSSKEVSAEGEYDFDD